MVSRRIVMIVGMVAVSTAVVLVASCAPSGVCGAFISTMDECDAFVNNIGTTSALVPSVSSFPPRAGHTSVVFGGAMWVIGGFGATLYNDVWYSADGAQWYAATTNAPFVARVNHASVVFDGKMWVIGGGINRLLALNQTLATNNDVVDEAWSSRDGTNWSLESGTPRFPARLGHTALAFGGKLWVIGGLAVSANTTNPTGLDYANDVWSSSDGKTWNQEIQNAAFSERVYHASAVFEGKMWVIGGFDGATSAYSNDAWSSTDGVTWIQETANAGFSPRQNTAAAPFVRRLWVVGGRISGGAQDVGDVWVLRKDGTWFAAPYAISPRSQHTVVTLNEKLFIIGGINGTQPYDDVWSIE